MEFRPSRRLGLLPLLLSLALAGFAALPEVRANPILLRTFLGTAGLLAGWAAWLLVKMARQGRVPSFAVALLKQHYVQACVHTSILLYWGWYVPVVYDHAYLILAQLVFAYAFDMLLQLSRKGQYTLGFGPFPIIFSINLFLWFRDDWFYFQFLLIALGFAAKEFLHWMRNGKSVHIFNPSSFPLAIASLVLLMAHNFGITWGEEIAGSQYRPPHIFLFIFLVALPGQFFFGVTSMTLPAVVTMYLWGMAYLATTGTYYLTESYIPIAVFLAMHLLFTDPSTSPRTELGRILYGILYAGVVIVLELTLRPLFPSKLLLVPLLNLSVQLIDRVARSPALRWLDPARFMPAVTGRRRNLAYMAVWAAVFGLMTAAKGIGDDFPGQRIPFWISACEKQLEDSCDRLSHYEVLACRFHSGWACNELGLERQAKHDSNEAARLFSLACKLEFQPGCENEALVGAGRNAVHAQPAEADYPILMSLFKWVKRPKLEALSRADLNARACREGWPAACSAQ